MTLQDQMNRLLDAAPDISLLAFGDLSSGLILNWAARAPCPREGLDLLGEQAARCFALMGPDRLDGTVAGPAMIHFTEHETRIFVRAGTGPDEAGPQDSGFDDVVCAVCDAGAELEPLFHAACDLAKKIAGTA